MLCTLQLLWQAVYTITLSPFRALIDSLSNNFQSFAVCSSGITFEKFRPHTLNTGTVPFVQEEADKNGLPNENQ